VTALPRRALLLVPLLAAACAGRRAAPSAPAQPARPTPASLRFEPLAHGSYGPEPHAEPTGLEQAALEAVRARLGEVGPPPRVSPALVLAARRLARLAAAGDPDPLSRRRLRAALAGALAFDPAPTAHLAVADPASAPRALLGTIPTAGSPTHVGAGAAMRAGEAYLVVLLSRRTAALRPFPRDVKVGASATLRGELLGLDRAAVHVTPPSGRSRPIAAGEASGVRSFGAPVVFDAPGRWLVEVVGRGERGPEVAALLTVSCGGAPLEDGAAAADETDPPDPRDAEARVMDAVNAMRRRNGLPTLEPMPALSAVARRHSEAMLASGILAHVLPEDGSVADRLRAARIPYARVAENVAKGGSAMAAHRGTEESPAHRESILSSAAKRVGCGIARGRLPTGDAIVYVTEVFLEPVQDGSDDRMTVEARVREAMWAERDRLRAPPLLSDPALDELARAAAREMLRRGEPGDERLPDRALAIGRKLAAVDAFVATKPTDAIRSQNLPDPRFRRVGVGVAIGDSKRYGAGLLWIVVLYTN
jgi:uncharacterized protein YkwD